jgi:hypothetical protein
MVSHLSDYKESLQAVTVADTTGPKTKETKFRGLSQRANYIERPPLIGEVSANICG